MDDYDGGDICFYINGDFVNYKPKAGDILVFPSGMPYYHGVKTIRNGNKFFIRNFISQKYSTELAQKVYKGKMSRRSIQRMMDGTGSESRQRRNYVIQVIDATILAGGDYKPGDVATINLMSKNIKFKTF